MTPTTMKKPDIDDASGSAIMIKMPKNIKRTPKKASFKSPMTKRNHRMSSSKSLNCISVLPEIDTILTPSMVLLSNDNFGYRLKICTRPVFAVSGFSQSGTKVIWICVSHAITIHCDFVLATRYDYY